MRPTREQIANLKQGESIELQIPEKCDVCGFGAYGDILVVRIPEGFSMCEKCCDRFPDKEPVDPKVGAYVAWIIGKGPVEKAE